MPDLRKDPILGRWVIVASERSRRPSDFHTETEDPRASFCPFCEGNEDKTPPEIAAVRAPGTPRNGPGWRVRVVPNAADHFEPLPREPREDAPLVHVGHVEPRKNIELLLRALAHDPALPRLVLAGAPGSRRRRTRPNARPSTNCTIAWTRWWRTWPRCKPNQVLTTPNT